MEDLCTHQFTASDGSVFRCIKDEKGTNLPVLPGILDRIKAVRHLDLNDDDVIVCTYPKSGTHWVGNIAYMLQHKEEIKQPDWTEYPDRYFFEMIDRDMYVNEPSPRLFDTHLPPEYLPREQIAAGKGKILYVRRNPKDLLVSLFHHMIKCGMYTGSVHGLVELFLQNKVIYGDWFAHKDLYDQFIHDNSERCLKLVFEDMKQDPRDNVRRIARFLNVEVSEGEITLILELCSVDRMRERVLDGSGHEHPDRALAQQFYRKGMVDDWKNYFTVATNEMFDRKWARRMEQRGEL